MRLTVLLVGLKVVALWPWWAPAAAALCVLLVVVAVRDGRAPERAQVPQCPDGRVRRRPGVRTSRTGRCPDNHTAAHLSCADTVRDLSGRGY